MQVLCFFVHCFSLYLGRLAKGKYGMKVVGFARMDGMEGWMPKGLVFAINTCGKGAG